MVTAGRLTYPGVIEYDDVRRWPLALAWSLPVFEIASPAKMREYQSVLLRLARKDIF